MNAKRKILIKAMEEQTDEQVEVVPESQGRRKRIHFMISVMMKAALKPCSCTEVEE